MMIDLDLLHKNIEQPSYTRRSGRTFTMMVELLGNADFYGPDIYIFCPSQRHAAWAMDFLVQIAESMGFNIDRKTGFKSQIGKRMFTTTRYSAEGMAKAGRNIISAYE